MNSTELKMQYADRSKAYELPDHLELALENDYVENAGLYSDNTFKAIQMLYLINPGIYPADLLKCIRAWHITKSE